MFEEIKNNKGTTLVELMIYMIVALIVTTLAFRVISRAAIGYNHGRAVSKAQFNARDGMNVMARDIASMGYKMYFYDFYPDNSTPPATPTKDSMVMTIDSIASTTKHDIIVGNNRQNIDPAGNDAAFFFTDGGDAAGDTLEFFRITVNDEGERTARERILYYLDEKEKQVIREYFVFDSTKNNSTLNEFADWVGPDTTIIASNVVALNFRFSKIGDGTDWTSSIPTTLKRNDVRHIEVAILTKAHRESRGQYGATSYLVGDRTYTTPTDETKFVHRLYRQSIEVPNNATGLE